MKKILILIFIFSISLYAKTKADYYEMLRLNCSDNCCYYAYQIMKRNNYVLHTDTDDCTQINQLKCSTTYRWCTNITYEENIYKKKLKF